MLDEFKTSARRAAATILRGGWYPILLPHHRIVAGGLSTLGEPPKPMRSEWLAALALCEGARTLADVSRQAGVSRQQLLAARAEELLILWPEPVPTPTAVVARPAAVILSPHLDDAALSLGGMMLDAPGGVVVVDVFSTVSWWRFKGSLVELPRIQQARDAEESLVVRLARCELRKWAHGEAPLRGYPFSEIFTAAVLPSDDGLRRSIREAIAKLAAEFPAATFFLPLGVGNHVDHRILRDAAIDVLRPANGAARVRFYEDLPYAAKTPERRDFSAFIPGQRLRPAEQFKYGRLKTELLRIYWSQLTGAQIRMVGDYGERFALCRAERVWTCDGAQ